MDISYLQPRNRLQLLPKRKTGARPKPQRAIPLWLVVGVVSREVDGAEDVARCVRMFPVVPQMAGDVIGRYGFATLPLNNNFGSWLLAPAMEQADNRVAPRARRSD
jgi:hypothetical protein